MIKWSERMLILKLIPKVSVYCCDRADVSQSLNGGGDDGLPANAQSTSGESRQVCKVSFDSAYLQVIERVRAGIVHVVQ